MNHTGIIIQARTGSTRLPRKVILPFYKELCILDILIDRLRRAVPTIPIVVATSTAKTDQPITEIAQRHGVYSYQGSEDNVLSRMLDAAEHYEMDSIIRVCADNPFLNTDFLNQLIEAHQGEDYLSYSFSDGTPVIKSHLGLFAEATTRKTLRRVKELTKEQLYLEHVTNYIYAHPEVFHIKWLPLPPNLDNRKELRFTADTKEDFNMYQEIFATLTESYTHDFTLDRLISLMDENDDFLKIMNIEIQKNSK